MKLELASFYVKDIQFCEKTEFRDGILKVNKQELIELLLCDNRLKDVELDIARPGEETRIIPVKDVIEPRIKASGNSVFPGFLENR